MRKVHRACILFALLVFFPLAGWSIPINRTEVNRQSYPELDNLTDLLDPLGIDTLFEFRPDQRTMSADQRPRLATLDGFPIRDLQSKPNREMDIYQSIAIDAPDLHQWERAFQTGQIQALVAVSDGMGREVGTLQELRRAWNQVSREKRIFISYTSANQAEAIKIKELLIKRGYAVFTYLEIDGTLTTSLEEVFNFFSEAGRRYVIDSPAARASVGVQIEARFHELFRQLTGQAKQVPFKEVYEAQRRKRAKNVEDMLEPRLTRLSGDALRLEEWFANQSHDPTDKAKLERRRDLRDRIEGLHELQRIISIIPRRDPPPPPPLAAIPKLPPRPPMDQIGKVPDFGGPPAPGKPNTGGYQSKVVHEQKGVRLDLKKSKIQNRLQISPFRGRGGVILGNEPIEFPKGPSGARISLEGDNVKIQVDLNGSRFEYDGLTPTEVWCAYHFLSPTKQLIDQGADPHDPGVSGINGKIIGGWKFKIHPALADTIFAREAMRLDMVCVVDDLRLPPLPPLYATYRWYDVPAIISAEKGRLRVSPSREPFSTMLRLQLWDEIGPLPIDTDRFVEAVASRLDACQRIDRLARVLAVLRWLELSNALPALPDEIQPKKFNVPPEWRFKDIFPGPPTQVGEGRFTIPAQGVTQTHILNLPEDHSYSLWPNAKNMTFEIQDPSGEVIKQKSDFGVVAFKSKKPGTYKIIAKSKDNLAKEKNYSLVVLETTEILRKKKQIAQDSLVQEKTELKEGSLYQIEMRSSAFQSFLRLKDKEGKTIRETSQNVPESIFNRKAIELKDGKDKYIGALNDKDAITGNHYYKLFTIKLEKGTKYRIDYKNATDGSNFDAFLFLEDPDGRILAEDDDSGGGLDSRIVHTAAVTGAYRIIATTLPAKQTGKFTLEVSPGSKEDKETPLVKERVRSIDSIIVWTAEKTGPYQIICGAERDGSGSFELMVTKHRTLYP